MDSQILDFSEWAPDAPLLGGKQVSEARNVVPIARGYRSMHSLSKTIYPALPAACLGAHSLKSMDGSVFTLAGTRDGLYSLEGGKWVSKYSDTAVDTQRAFADYGSDIYALYGTQLVRATISGKVGDFTAVEAAPRASVIGVVKDFLVLGSLSETRQLNAIRWSAIDDPTTWPAVGSDEAQYVQSDIQAFPVGGRVQAIVGGIGGMDGLIFLESSIQRATYIGTPYIFQFDPVDRERGLLAPKSPVVAGSQCFYLSNDGWRATDGSSVRAIGAEKINRWFFDNAAPGRLSEVVGAHDADNSLALWVFASKHCPDTEFDRILVYNYLLGRWSYGIVSTEYIWPDFTRGMTLEDLDQYGPLDDLPFASLDVTQLKNQRLGISAFNPSHFMCRFNGPAEEAVVDTGEIGGRRLMIHGLRPLVDRDDSVAYPIYRDRQAVQRKFGREVAQSRDGVCYQHQSTSYFAARVRVPAGESWKNMVGVEAFTEDEGGL